MACVNSFLNTVQVPTYDFGPNQAMKHCMFSVLNVQRKLQNLNPSKEAGSDLFDQMAFSIIVLLRSLTSPLIAENICERERYLMS